MTVSRRCGGCGWLDLRAVRRWFVRYRCDPQRVVLGTARSRAGGVVKSLSALCCRVCSFASRCARSVGSQVAQWWLGGVVRGNFDACVQRGRVCGLRSFTRGRGSGPRTDQKSSVSTVSTNLSPFVSSCPALIAIIGFFPTQSAFWLRCPLRGVRTGPTRVTEPTARIRTARAGLAQERSQLAQTLADASARPSQDA